MDVIVRKHLQPLIDRVDGLSQLVVTDRDGVPISVIGVAGADTVPRPQLLTSYPQAVEQIKKLHLANHKSMICYYGKYQMVILNCAPFAVTLIATFNANTGAILALRSDLEPILAEVNAVVGELLPKDLQ